MGIGLLVGALFMQVTVREVARMLGVSEKSVYHWVEKAEIPFYKINEQYRFNRSEILEWATHRSMKIAPEFFSVDKPGDSSLPSLLAAVSSGGIFYKLPGSDLNSALHSIVDTLALPPGVDREFLYDVLIARETMGSTGVGNGIAIPHVRNPLVLHVKSPTVSICFLEHPIDFHALDGKPVNVLFTIISPTVRSHLHLLSRIGFVLHNQEMKEALVRQAPKEELLNLLEMAERLILAIQ